MARTTDGGDSWKNVTTDATDELTAVAFTDAEHGSVAGSSEAMLWTSDGGASWTTLSSKKWGLHFNDIVFADDVHGWAAAQTGVPSQADCRGRLFRTDDGGRSWSRVESYDPADTSQLCSVAVRGAGACCIAGSNTLLVSNDNASTWANGSPHASTSSGSASPASTAGRPVKKAGSSGPRTAASTGRLRIPP